MPAFNGVRFIAEAIDSVLGQTYRNVEVIVVDDGSTDGTKGLCQGYGSRIKYIYQENAGISSARNTGIDQAKGDLICLMDQDDIMKPFKIELQVAYMQHSTKEIGFLFTDFTRIKDGAIITEASSRSFFEVFRTNPKLTYKDIFQQRTTFQNLTLPCPEEYLSYHIYAGNIVKHLIYGNLILPSTTMFKRDSLEHFDPSVIHYEDYELFSRIAKKYQAAYLDIPTVLYRVHDTNFSGPVNYESRILAYYRHIEKLWAADPRFYAAFKQEIDRSLSLKSYSLARYYILQKDYTRACSYFSKSLRHSRRQRGSYIFFIFTYFMSRFAWSRGRQ